MQSLNKLILSVVCLTVLGAAPDAVAEPRTESDRSTLSVNFSANQPLPEIELQEIGQTDQQQALKQQSEQLALEQQSIDLSAVSYPNPFLDSEVSLEAGASLSLANKDSVQTASSVLLTQVVEVQPTGEQSIEVQSTEAQFVEDWSVEEQSTLAQSTEEKVPPKFGQAGKQRWYVQGGVGADFDDDLFGLVGAGVSHFFFDGHSLSLELNGLAVDQEGNNAVGLNLALLLRSHWIRGDNWSIYIDGGAGLLTTNNDVPDAGSSFNFTPQIGGGATFAVNDTQRIMTGLRWYHISNANTFEANPGLDAVYGYVGYNFPF